MLPNFTYVRPNSLADAMKELAAPGARLHAGGTDLLGCLRSGVMTGEKLVSISGLKELRGISTLSGGEVRIGAMTTLAEIARHPMIRERYLALAQAANAAASPQLRNQGTIGGNLCQRPRCWYFRGDFSCFRKGGENCFALGGENELHAIFGANACYAVHPSDTATALTALGAQLRIAGMSGTRLESIEKFFVSPAENLTTENILKSGEIVTDIVLPSAPAGLFSSYRKVRERGSWDFAIASIALALEMKAGKVESARIVLGGVASSPWRAKDAEKAILGARLNAKTIQAAAEASVHGAEPMSKNGYKVMLVRGIVEEALMNVPHA